MFSGSVRALAGTLTAGLVVLALVVTGAAVLGLRRDFPGPGLESVAAHVLGALVALAVQVRADRGRGGVLALLAVTAIAVALLWTQWWN